MADVRSAVGAATTGVFTGPVGTQVGTPIYINLANGDVSFLLPGDVIYTMANGMQNIIATMVFGKHMVPQQRDLGDANEHLSNRAFDRQFFPLPAVNNTLSDLGAQIFAAHVKQPGVLGDANDIIRGISFMARPFAAPMNFSAGTMLENRAMRTAQLPAMWT